MKILCYQINHKQKGKELLGLKELKNDGGINDNPPIIQMQDFLLHHLVILESLSFHLTFIAPIDFVNRDSLTKQPYQELSNQPELHTK